MVRLAHFTLRKNSVIASLKSLTFTLLTSTIFREDYHQTYRFAPNDYVTISRIEKCDLYRGIVETHSGSVYVLQGVGTDAAIDFRDFELLRMGYSPQQISNFNSADISTWH
ncbi:hypothetical protein PSECIP111854_00004 [Pseudoalteromonas sp. CIP111854]|uniref:Uncharacterized protein n=2 Tax=Pseudoalteromonas holothuriae TaxID=2963714 RepID=A0A9W4QQP4_9GAMM|nr:hypothetical protein PSECIP111854_00004 [Pseudoalteromonas sp. CIP111854]